MRVFIKKPIKLAGFENVELIKISDYEKFNAGIYEPLVFALAKIVENAFMQRLAIDILRAKHFSTLMLFGFNQHFDRVAIF